MYKSKCCSSYNGLFLYDEKVDLQNQLFQNFLALHSHHMNYVFVGFMKCTNLILGVTF